MSPVGGEVGAIHRPDFAAFGEFAHAHETGIGEIHRSVGVFRGEGEHPRQLGGEVKGGVENQVTAGDELEDAERVGKKACRFAEHGIADMKRGVLLEDVQRP